jgi:hypothetical protein
MKRIGLIWLGVWAEAVSCEQGNELSGSIKCWKIFEHLRNQLLKKDLFQWV